MKCERLRKATINWLWLHGQYHCPINKGVPDIISGQDWDISKCVSSVFHQAGIKPGRCYRKSESKEEMCSRLIIFDLLFISNKIKNKNRSKLKLSTVRSQKFLFRIKDNLGILKKNKKIVKSRNKDKLSHNNFYFLSNVLSLLCNIKSESLTRKALPFEFVWIIKNENTSYSESFIWKINNK